MDTFLFMFSSSLIHPYILPSIIPIALIVEYYWKETKKKNKIIWVSLIFPILIVITTIVSLVGNNLEFYIKTDKYLLKNTDYSNSEIYYLGDKSYSSQFYSKGKIKNITTEQLRDKLNQNNEFNIIIEERDLKNIDSTLLKELKLLSFNNFNGIYMRNLKKPTNNSVYKK